MLRPIQLASRWIVGVVAVLFVAHVFTTDDRIESKWVPWLLIAMLASGVVAALTWDPVLRFADRGPKLVGGEFVDGLRTSQGGRHIQVIGVQIYNERESGGETKTARAVVPEVEAFELSGTSIKRTRGVWFASPEGAAVPTVDFRPTRVEQHPVELVGRFPDEDNAYLAGEPGSPSLTPGDYRIRITLRGDNVKRPARLDFYVRNPGGGRRLTVARKESDLVDGDAYPVAAAEAVTAAAPDPAPVNRTTLVTPAAGVQSAKLDVRFTRRGRGTYTLTVINTGDVDMERVEWILPPEALNWHILEESLAAYPIPLLEPGDEQSAIVALTMGGPAAIEITLRGWVLDNEYTRTRTISAAGA